MKLMRQVLEDSSNTAVADLRAQSDEGGLALRETGRLDHRSECDGLQLGEKSLSNHLPVCLIAVLAI